MEGCVLAWDLPSRCHLYQWLREALMLSSAQQLGVIVSTLTREG